MSPYLKELEMLVLDEADMLLRLGFQKSLTTILSRLPKQVFIFKYKPSYLSCLILIQEQRVSHELEYQ